ncbi:amidohydrolase family protein [Saccharibacillus qingshengii]|uniref:amidohydrolase family protein n=1 Tax=Saccharibacillus qingshengii TaxID=1763540 RepID=UPI0015576264|nr:amidohydrolase family protein [Saccharibacillus qingshengii]
MILQRPIRKSFRNIAIAGISGRRFDIKIERGRFVSVRDAAAQAPASSASEPGTAAVFSHEELRLRTAAEEVDGTDLWISPGLIDLHTHMGWTDFDHADQAKRDSAEVEAMQADAFEATLRTGVTTVRDAGGLLPEAAKRLIRKYGHPLRVHNGSHMFGAADAQGLDYLKRKMDEVLASGADWIKIMATGGLGSPTEQVSDPILSDKEFAFLVRYAHEHGRRVFVHTWGGVTVDWAAEAGVESIEHGMFVTREQAERLAERNVAWVPTASIYRIAADPDGVLGLPPVIQERAMRAVEAHAHAVGYAKLAGVRLGFGTDYATPALHGRNLQEMDALALYGLSRAEIWHSATTGAAEILGRAHELGRIGEGLLADAALFAADPLAARSEEELRGSIVCVLTAAAADEWAGG